MPAVITFRGFRVVINTHDHTPRHVHVLRAGGVVIIEIDSLEIVTLEGMSNRDVRTAVQLVTDNQAFLASEWDRIGPIA